MPVWSRAYCPLLTHSPSEKRHKFPISLTAGLETEVGTRGAIFRLFSFPFTKKSKFRLFTTPSAALA